MNSGFQSASWMKVLWMDEGRGVVGGVMGVDVDENQMDAHRVVQAEGRRRGVALGCWRW
jgi:hypothetical protein